MARMTTLRERFETADYPAVCARSGRPADKMVSVEAARRATWPNMFLALSLVAALAAWRGVAVIGLIVVAVVSLAIWLLAGWVVDQDRIRGWLPFAEGQTEGVTATWNRRKGVVALKGLHPGFLSECRTYRAAEDGAEPPIKAEPQDGDEGPSDDS